MVLDAPGRPLVRRRLPRPEAGPGQVLVRVGACAVCRTDLHVVDGDLPDLGRPVIPGHEIVGRVAGLGAGVQGLAMGERVGVPWLGWTCGHCRYCRSGRENLCPSARFTGYQIDGGYADYTVADARYCFPLPGGVSDPATAPLLCAGLIGWRSLVMAGDDAAVLGIYGFGAAAHIVVQVALHQGRRVFAFTRDGDQAAQAFALRLGCTWAGASGTMPPEPLDAAILFAPVGALVPAALAALRPGGIVVCGGIHMSDIPQFAYDLLWREKRVVSVANLTRHDGDEFLALAPKVPVHTEVETMPLAEANEALERLRAGRLTGALVLVPEGAANEGETRR
ncbi:MAG: zinc-dependent alcohol dehydrogenase family protein [Rhodospirillales bacterium]